MIIRIVDADGLPCLLVSNNSYKIERRVTPVSTDIFLVLVLGTNKVEIRCKNLDHALFLFSNIEKLLSEYDKIINLSDISSQ